MKIEFENFEVVDNNTQNLSVCLREDNTIYIQIKNMLSCSEGDIDKSAWYELTPKQLSQLIGSLLHLQSKIKNNKQFIKLS